MEMQKPTTKWYTEAQMLAFQAATVEACEPVGYVYSIHGEVSKSATIDRSIPNGTPLYLHPPVPEPQEWLDMVAVNLVREGVNKHKARELAAHFAAIRGKI
jgi:hypothetical protein